MTKTFEMCVKEHIGRYPKAQPQDLYKLCFQAAFGAEHLLQDEERARQYLQKEYDDLTIGFEEPDAEQLLLEWIAPEVVRVHLAAYKAKGFPLEHLFRTFIGSAREFIGSKENLDDYLEIIAQMASKEEISFSREEWDLFCAGREVAPVHHSQMYRETYKPSYRVIAGRYISELETYRN